MRAKSRSCQTKHLCCRVLCRSRGALSQPCPDLQHLPPMFLLKKKADNAYALACLLIFFSFLCPSRHPVVRKWPRSYEWFFMKMNIEHIWLQNWYGEVSPIAVEEYLKMVSLQ
uniref:CREG-like beta-barrel domain-containing protein n=1 Tax=Malurus cyaneus samueli TaxID=2593467 RepID=A0A8C5XA43_9PASS